MKEKYFRQDTSMHKSEIQDLALIAWEVGSPPVYKYLWILLLLNQETRISFNQLLNLWWIDILWKKKELTISKNNGKKLNHYSLSDDMLITLKIFRSNSRKLLKKRYVKSLNILWPYSRSTFFRYLKQMRNSVEINDHLEQVHVHEFVCDSSNSIPSN